MTTTYNRQQVQLFAAKAGFVGKAQDIIVAIAFAESGWRDSPPDNINNDSIHSHDRGILQLNSYWHSEVDNKCAYNPQCAFNAAYRISNKGTNFNAWTTFTGGNYLKYLSSGSNASGDITYAYIPPVSSGGNNAIGTVTTTFNSVAQNVHTTLQTVPGMLGIVEALDKAETFQAFELKSNATASNPNNTDFIILGIDTGIPNPSADFKALTSPTALPSEAIQAAIVFIVANTQAAAIRLLLIFIGVALLMALGANAMQSTIQNSGIDPKELVSLLM